MDIQRIPMLPSGQSAPCLRKEASASVDPVKTESREPQGKSASVDPVKTEPRELPGLESSISTMKAAVNGMGIPEHIVELAIQDLLWTKGTSFSVTDLLPAAEKLSTNVARQQSIESEIKRRQEEQQGLEEEAAQAKAEKKKTSLSCKDDCGSSESPACPSVEMLKVTEAPQVPADKSALREKVMRLARENHKLKLRKTCRSCKSRELASSGVTFLPCGHFITCEECSEKFDDCPSCGKSIMGTVRTFLS